MTKKELLEKIKDVDDNAELVVTGNAGLYPEDDMDHHFIEDLYVHFDLNTIEIHLGEQLVGEDIGRYLTDEFGEEE